VRRPFSAAVVVVALAALIACGNGEEAARELRFEYAARLRDEIGDLKRELKEVS
jgi:excinuclease UvrABC helicase subunit UvrB